MIERERLLASLETTCKHLLRMRTNGGFWTGRLSSSALSTATAVSALATAGRQGDREYIDAGCGWLVQNQNPDGGWGDTPDSPSNVSTTLLCLSALRLAEVNRRDTLKSAQSYVHEAIADKSSIAAAVTDIYGDDRTFAVPILMNCALAGLVEWDHVPELPFELAALPRWLYRVAGLQVVSYALPALIAVGMVIAEHRSAGGIKSAIRGIIRSRLLRLLELMQPPSGGYLEAAPLTAFVAMSLTDCIGADQPVAKRCRKFLRNQMRPDGSWPIDANLSVWVTTAALGALYESGGASDAQRTRRWIRRQQTRAVHPFTGAAPGGWPWTHHPGGVPDADDTSGAILALGHCASVPDGQDTQAISRGVRWLLDLQNSDGGWPTFCRGWGKLPFDQSCPDITAHALRALSLGTSSPGPRVENAIDNGIGYLCDTQRPDGAWLPLWFGNQHARGGKNPVLGTARVLAAIGGLEGEDIANRREKGVKYLLGAQHHDGGWGGAPGVAPSVEETALSVIALLAADKENTDSVEKGLQYLLDRVEEGTWTQPAPIGLYFASLWYSEQMYPVVWTVEALGRAAEAFEEGGFPSS